MQADHEALEVRGVAAGHRNTFVEHDVVGNIVRNLGQVPLIGSEHSVRFCAYTKTGRATWWFVHTHVHCFVRPGDHEAVAFRERKAVIVMHFTRTSYVPSRLSL